MPKKFKFGKIYNLSERKKVDIENFARSNNYKLVVKKVSPKIPKIKFPVTAVLILVSALAILSLIGIETSLIDSDPTLNLFLDYAILISVAAFITNTIITIIKVIINYRFKKGRYQSKKPEFAEELVYDREYSWAQHLASINQIEKLGRISNYALLATAYTIMLMLNFAVIQVDFEDMLFEVLMAVMIVYSWKKIYKQVKKFKPVSVQRYECELIL